MAHLDRPYKDWATTVGSVPAHAMRLPDHGRIAPGLPANLVLFKGRGYSELLARPQWDRVGTSYGFVLALCVALSVCAACLLVERLVCDVLHSMRISLPSCGLKYWGQAVEPMTE